VAKRKSDLDIRIHGWDATGWFSHQPTGVRPASLLRKLKKAPGAFHGRFACRVPGTPVLDIQATAYDLADSGLAIVHLDDDPGGPIGALTVIPAHRRSRLRNDFAFGYVAHLSFLGGLITPDSELAIYEYIENTLRTQPPSTLVFTVEAARLCPDVSIALSAFVEQLSAAMLHWLCDKDAEAERGAEDRAASLVMPGQAPVVRIEAYAENAERLLCANAMGQEPRA
jgi:hypothetical protein